MDIYFEQGVQDAFGNYLNAKCKILCKYIADVEIDYLINVEMDSRNDRKIFFSIPRHLVRATDKGDFIFRRFVSKNGVEDLEELPILSSIELAVKGSLCKGSVIRLGSKLEDYAKETVIFFKKVYDLQEVLTYTVFTNIPLLKKYYERGGLVPRLRNILHPNGPNTEEVKIAFHDFFSR